ncbi:hypothetical protein [Lacticaseibacillus pantheris]|jgi:hypothetical protein
MVETFKSYIGGLVKAAAMGELPDEPRLYYLVRYYPHAAQHDYYLVRQGNTRVELPGYRGLDAQWTWDECERVDSKHVYKRVLVEDEG